jgi:hypothetical protein
MTRLAGRINPSRSGARNLGRGLLRRGRGAAKWVTLVLITVVLATLIAPATGRLIWVGVVALLGYIAGRMHASIRQGGGRQGRSRQATGQQAPGVSQPRS